jgi:ABC-2 type transport system permease protein
VRRIRAIARKELEIAFTTPVAWVVLMLVAFVSSLVFNGYLDAYRYVVVRAMAYPAADPVEGLNLTDFVMTRLYAWVGIVILVAAPFLSMRLLAEERRARTAELLLTTPVRPIEIVLGKYLAALVTLAAAVAVAALYPVILAAYAHGARGAGAVEWQTVGTALLGVFLLGAMALAVGLFASALTDSMVVAALGSLFVLLGLTLVPFLAATVEGPLREVALALSPVQHLGAFLSGRIELRAVVYFLSFATLGIWLSDRAVEGHRWI